MAVSWRVEMMANPVWVRASKRGAWEELPKANTVVTPLRSNAKVIARAPVVGSIGIFKTWFLQYG